MAHTRQSYNEQQRKKALAMLKEVEKKIKDRELEVQDFGFWTGAPGNWHFKVSGKIVDSEETS